MKPNLGQSACDSVLVNDGRQVDSIYDFGRYFMYAPHMRWNTAIFQVSTATSPQIANHHNNITTRGSKHV